MDARPGQAPAGGRASMTPGLAAPILPKIGGGGKQHTTTALAEGLDQNQVDAVLQNQWNGMKAALMRNDIEGALQFFVESVRPRYHGIFTRLGSQLAQIAHDMQDIEIVSLTEGEAKYRIRRTETAGGQPVTLTFYIYFLLDVDNVWRIESF